MKSYSPVLLVVLLIGVVVAGCGTATASSPPPAGFLTTRPAQIRGLAGNVTFQPIITTGDTFNNYTMAAIPDGLGAFDNGDGTFTLLMNHELTKEENLSDARVSKLRIDKKTLRVQQANYLIDGTQGYRRFCSATMVGPDEGFQEPLFLTGEEATDGPFKGIVVAVNPKTGTRTDLPWLGHLAHENTLALPGFGKIVVLTTDDSAPGYLYMYVANNQQDFLSGRGQLYVLIADAGKTPDAISKTKPTAGKFVPVSQSENTDAKALKSASAAKGAMAFARLEDLAYDSSKAGLLYFVTTGRSEYVNKQTNKPFDAKGRLHSLQLDTSDPTKVTSLQVLLDGNEGDPIVNPDNIATSDKSIMLQEDLNEEFRGVHAGRILRYDLQTHTVTPVAEVVQKDETGKALPNDKLGSWESSGIINMAGILGPDQWLVVVQAHTLKVKQFNGQDEGGQLLLLKVPGSADK
ncbi:MAG: DUF839 domain-containing protein [Ktedonobacteraceae bacterium]|nr:DUF839 domain-containing protein [Ktedonobacteraceae bacterium]